MSENSDNKKVNVNINLENKNTTDMRISEKSKLIAFLLCTFLGWIGVHRFYVGKVGSGIGQIILVAFFGLGFIWVLIDWIIILAGSFKDIQGNLVRNWQSK